MINRRHVLLGISSTVALAAAAIAHAIPIFGSIRSPLDPSALELVSSSDIPFGPGTIVKLIGVGGAGFNLVEHMIGCECGGIEFIHADIDAQALSRSSAHNTVRLGEAGLCVEGKAELTCEVIQVAEQAIRSAIDGAHMLFIAAGLGGDTGTVAVPVIARIAKEMGILTVGIATMPFAWEGRHRMEKANAGLTEFESNAHSVIVVDNEKLLEAFSHKITENEVFAYANYLSKSFVSGLINVLYSPGHV